MSPSGFPDYPTSLPTCEVYTIVFQMIYNFPRAESAQLVSLVLMHPPFRQSSLENASRFLELLPLAMLAPVVTRKRFAFSRAPAVPPGALPII